MYMNLVRGRDAYQQKTGNPHNLLLRKRGPVHKNK